MSARPLKWQRFQDTTQVRGQNLSVPDVPICRVKRQVQYESVKSEISATTERPFAVIGSD